MKRASISTDRRSKIASSEFGTASTSKLKCRTCRSRGSKAQNSNRKKLAQPGPEQLRLLGHLLRVGLQLEEGRQELLLGARPERDAESRSASLRRQAAAG